MSRDASATTNSGSMRLLFPQVPPSSSLVKCLPRKREQLPDLKCAVPKLD